MRLRKRFSLSLEKCCGNELSLPLFTFCGNDTVTIMIVSAKFLGLLGVKILGTASRIRNHYQAEAELQSLQAESVIIRKQNYLEACHI